MTERLTQSYVNGVGTTPLIGDTIGRVFDRSVERWGEREALVCVHQGIRWTYRELRQKVDAYAAGLLALGLGKGDRLGIWSHNNAEWLLTQLATARIGVILVNINPAYRRNELTYALNKVGCKALVTMASYRTSDYLQILKDVAPEFSACEPGQLRAEKVPALRSVLRLGDDKTPGMFNFSQLPDFAGEAQRETVSGIGTELQFDDPINIQFTSGTTGRPKGATLTHHNILNNGYFVGEAIRLCAGDRLCVAVPLYHCFGMVMGNLACLTHGSTIVYAAEAFEAEAVLRAVEGERCTALYGVPTMFIAEMGSPDFAKYDLGSLRTGIMAGSPCPLKVMQRVIDEMHMSEVTIAYGMTETSPVSFQSSVDDPVERRVSTVGRIHPHLEVKIVDERDRVVAPGVPGELCTRGYSVMLGYWDDDEKTREVIDANGWMHTGDVATLDEHGYCNIVGRIKDMIIRGGENVYPREVEEFLYQHPAVEDVQVVGVPDPKYGEEVCAWIRLKAGSEASEEDIRAFCQDEIAHYKIPRYVRFVDEYPMTVTGKVQKFLIRKAMMEELDLTDDESA
jgi:fatty-acyl-CoA synthase